MKRIAALGSDKAMLTPIDVRMTDKRLRDDMALDLPNPTPHSSLRVHRESD
jgi:hypothetical protein